MELIKSESVLLRGVVDTHQGGRPENQDDFGFSETPLGFLFIICDGMGGGPGGKIASYNVKYEIEKVLRSCNPQTPCDKAFRMAVGIAHEALLKKIEEIPTLAGMGSTFVAVLISNHSAFIAHAGDSRCYQVRGRRLVYRTQDHSLVGELVRKKVLTEEEARISPQSNIITRGLGCVSNNIPDIVEVPYRKGDKFILCTDGVWGIMPHKELMRRFTADDDNKVIIRELSMEIEKIGKNNGGFHDNHTMGIIEMDCRSSLATPFFQMFKGFDFQLPKLFGIDFFKRFDDKYRKYVVSVAVALLIIICGCLLLPKLLNGEGGESGNRGEGAVGFSYEENGRGGLGSKKCLESILDFTNAGSTDLPGNGESTETSWGESDSLSVKEKLLSLLDDLWKKLQEHRNFTRCTDKKIFKKDYAYFYTQESDFLKKIDGIISSNDIKGDVSDEFNKLKKGIEDIERCMYSKFRKMDNDCYTATDFLKDKFDALETIYINLKTAISVLK